MLKLDTSPRFNDVHLVLPELAGSNIEDHFHHIGEMQSKSYRNLALSLVQSQAPSMPNVRFLNGFVL